MTESRNIYDLLSKIDWEGGFTGVLEYGLHDIDNYAVPDSLKDAWADMAAVWEEFVACTENVDAEIYKAENHLGEDTE